MPAASAFVEMNEPAALNGRHGLQDRFTNTNWNQNHEVSYYRGGCNAG